MENNQTSVYTHAEFMLKVMGVYEHFPGNGTIAINIQKLIDTYRVELGEMVNEQFQRVSASPNIKFTSHSDLASIADEELTPFGEAARLFDVYIDGKLVREAEK